MYSRIPMILLLGFSLAGIAESKPVKSGKVKTGEQVASSALDASNRLPVKRVVLYKNGVGYFEHLARVHDSQELSIDFTTSQLNDVLKSLTAVDMGDGRIANIRYNSIAPLDERLKGLRLPFGGEVNQEEFLSAMRGARVEVHSGSASATGRLLSVEKEKRFNEKGDSYEVTKFSVITDTGEMRNFDLLPGTFVRILDRELDDEVGKYLTLVGSARARDLRRMTISAVGSGERTIFVSYISEVPVWKSTYRVILPEKSGDKSLLQGWAIVDNTVGEDWKDVQLSLIAGAPQSFIQQISQPYYTRRPVVPLPSSVMLTPQEHEGSLSSGTVGGVSTGSGGGIGGGVLRGGSGGIRGRVTDPSGAVVPGAQITARNKKTGAVQNTVTDSRGVYQFFSLPAGNYSVSIGSPGFRGVDEAVNVLVAQTSVADVGLSVGNASETVEVTGAAPQLQTEDANIAMPAPMPSTEIPDLGADYMAARQSVEAESKEVGDYFEYNLTQKITIGKNQSALVPILQARVDAEQVSMWNENSREIRRALWLTNSSGLTLDSGSFDILTQGAFAGEGLMDTLHPDERRLISYAADPALRVTMEQPSGSSLITHIRILKGLMYLTYEQREARKYALHNSDSSGRQVVIEHPARSGWTLAPGPKPEETSASYMRFRVSVGPGQTENLQIEESRPEPSTVKLSNLDSNEVTFITQQRQISPAMLDAFRRVLDQKSKVDDLKTQIDSRRGEMDAISRDQARLRENLKALKGSPEEKALTERYTRELNSQEDHLATLKAEISDLEQKRIGAQAELDRMIQEISLDESF